jgi:hypothetical protein
MHENYLAKILIQFFFIVNQFWMQNSLLFKTIKTKNVKYSKKKTSI